jgi:hypothetical protein
MRFGKKGRVLQGNNLPIMVSAVVLALIAFSMIAFFHLPLAFTGFITAQTSAYVTGMFSSCNVSISLIEGWNLFSLPCLPHNLVRSSVLQDINGQYYSIHAYEANDILDHWKAYNPSLPSWVDQDLNAMSVERGYWINMISGGSILDNGTVSLPYWISLSPGWNLVGYPSNVSKTPADAFMEINNSITAVYAYNASDISDPWKSYVPGNPGNDLNIMNPSLGYWINASSGQMWTLTSG